MSAHPREAILLAGGMGTRLRSVVTDLPKPMAPVAGKPFLEHLFPSLKAAGIEHAVLSVGYKWEVIEAHFGREFMGISLDYAVEEQPLGTGGGIKLAFEKTTEQHVMVLNGDTLFRIDLAEHWRRHVTGGGLVSLALKPMRDFDRYGTVELGADERILAFKEKQPLKEGLINAGIYAMDRGIWGKLDLPERFSFEQDVLERQVGRLNFKGFVQDGYFIDIGIPEDYAKADADLRVP
ncbi:MAG: nucleotidyltransferase family protein [Bacteroidia bacterium]